MGLLFLYENMGFSAQKKDRTYFSAQLITLCVCTTRLPHQHSNSISGSLILFFSENYQNCICVSRKSIWICYLRKNKFEFLFKKNERCVCEGCTPRAAQLTFRLLSLPPEIQAQHKKGYRPAAVFTPRPTFQNCIFQKISNFKNRISENNRNNRR